MEKLGFIRKTELVELNFQSIGAVKSFGWNLQSNNNVVIGYHLTSGGNGKTIVNHVNNVLSLKMTLRTNVFGKTRRFIQLNLWDSNVGKMTLYSRWGQIPSNYRYIFFQRP